MEVFSSAHTPALRCCAAAWESRGGVVGLIDDFPAALLDFLLA